MNTNILLRPSILSMHQHKQCHACVYKVNSVLLNFHVNLILYTLQIRILQNFPLFTMKISQSMVSLSVIMMWVHAVNMYAHSCWCSILIVHEKHHLLGFPSTYRLFFISHSCWSYLCFYTHFNTGCAFNRLPICKIQTPPCFMNILGIYYIEQ